MTARKRSRFGAVVAGIAATTFVVGGLAACGENAEPTPPAASDTPSSSPTTETSPSPTDTATPSDPPLQPGDGLCRSKDLAISLSDGEGAAGTVFRSLTFKNVSDQPCTIQGFPGVSYVGGDDGHQIGKAAFREGSKGEPIKLNKGDSASADVGFVNVQNYDPDTCQLEEARGIRVYPPQETESKFVEKAGLRGCRSDKIPGNQLTIKTITRG